MRKHGLTVDQLLSVRMVTADGETLTASDTENTDLFWGVRGGGGNFGIIASFEPVSTPWVRRSTPASCSGRSTRGPGWYAATGTGPGPLPMS